MVWTTDQTTLDHIISIRSFLASKSVNLSTFSYKASIQVFLMLNLKTILNLILTGKKLACVGMQRMLQSPSLTFTHKKESKDR